MKYPPVRVAMPDGVCQWLEQELESRGIDAVVYTRYVLSLLRRDDCCINTDTCITNCKGPNTNTTTTATVRQRRRSYRASKCDPEQLRRTAAVDCLASACEEKCGIESLVDELCQKLKDFESEPVQSCEVVSPYEKSRYESNIKNIDPAARYYAAFPALGDKNRNRIFLTQKQEEQSQMDEMQSSDQMLSNPEPSLSSLIGDEGYSTNSDHETCDTAAPENDDDLDLEFEDLPVDIRGLLATPVTPENQPQTLQDFSFRPKQNNSNHRPYIRCGTNITSSIWSQDVDEVIQQNAPPPLAPRWSDGDSRRTVSLMQLNHGGESSSFVEVPPGSILRPFLPPQQNLQPRKLSNAGPEEDLLTSSKTHFRPITHDNGNQSNVTAVNTGQVYADGTTFQIKGSLERVSYRRTESGSIFLQKDGSASPERYLEWKPTDTPPPFSESFGNASIASNSDKDNCSFVVRFRVKQNEKCCQTDDDFNEFNSESLLGSTSGEETPPPKKRVLSERSCCDDDCELYFPGDCELLLHEQWRSGGTNCANCNTDDIWGSACSECVPLQKTRSHHSCARELRRLRDELSREGDQLLNDLQRIVLLPTIESTTAILPQTTAQNCHDYRKRRHSGAPATMSFAQRINAWPPQFHSLLRPVTL